MFFNQKINKIQEAKNRLAICSDLRRKLVHIEIHSFWSGLFNTVLNLTLGLAVIEQVLVFLRKYKGNRS